MTELTQLPADLLTIPGAARRLGIGKDLAYRMAERGELPGAFKVGARWRVSVVRLEEFMHGRRTTEVAS